MSAEKQNGADDCQSPNPDKLTSKIIFAPAEESTMQGDQEGFFSMDVSATKLFNSELVGQLIAGLQREGFDAKRGSEVPEK